MKKTILLALLLMLAIHPSYAQDSTALINTSWVSYASDPNLTYQQITTTCDSLFGLAGYPDTATSDTVWAEHDGTPYTEYLRWKNFWSTRCDVTTGKLHSFVADALPSFGGSGGSSLGPSSSFSSPNCGGASLLQSSITTVPVTLPGWKFIGPQNITTSGSNGTGNSQIMHIGRVDDIIVNPTSFSVVATSPGSSMPSEVYATDRWGGLWKTNNAQLAPNNTWTCLSDHLPYMAGIGVTNLYVDFTTPLHRLFCTVGVPIGYCLPNMTDYLPHTVGIFYSLDDGASFIPLPMPALTPPVGVNPIFDMKYWPGNTATGPQYLFVSTQFQVFRVDITSLTNNPATTAATWTAIIDEYSSIPPYPTSADQGYRFLGFTEMGFTQSSSTHDVMYLATNTANNGIQYLGTAALYRINNISTCSTCTLTSVPISTSDFLNNSGSFSAVGFPGNYSQWWESGWGQVAATIPYIECIPQLPSGPGVVQSVETAVAGSYLDNITYNISFIVTLPPYTRVDVVLKDAAVANLNNVDWGTTTTPTPSDVSAYALNFGVGTGCNFTSTGTGPLTDGEYINNTNASHSYTVSLASVPANHFVDRLEFAAYIIPGSPITSTSSYVTLSGVVVNQPYENNISNFASSSTNGYSA